MCCCNGSDVAVMDLTLKPMESGEGGNGSDQHIGFLCFDSETGVDLLRLWFGSRALNNHWCLSALVWISIRHLLLPPPHSTIHRIRLSIDPSDVKEGLLVHVGLKTVFPFLVRGGGCFSRETVIQTTSSPPSQKQQQVFECRFGSTPSLTLGMLLCFLCFQNLKSVACFIFSCKIGDIKKVLQCRFLGLDLLSCAYCISTRDWQSRKVENKLFIYTKVGEYINGVDINRRPVC
ncbi:hypothetical protein L2E82_48876 [Cichorium intybus]|uniref:Uncharacterized protein n=1 Tax=Cichorium intybus TaxID=13427 RepID=A0ACB8YY33_CICIN|nr:hypothetical protein L2E82_48876 [Cichorium intybus]